MKRTCCDVSDILEYLRNIIFKSAAQGLYTLRGQEAKVEFLYSAFVEHKWAFIALTTCYAQEEPWSVTQLSQALNPAWLQEKQ